MVTAITSITKMASMSVSPQPLISTKGERGSKPNSIQPKAKPTSSTPMKKAFFFQAKEFIRGSFLEEKLRAQENTLTCKARPSTREFGNQASSSGALLKEHSTNSRVNCKTA